MATRQRRNTLIDIRRCRLDRGAPTGRTLHLIDIENLIGDPMAGAPELSSAVDAYKAAVAIRPHDHVVVACNPKMSFNAKRKFPGALVKAVTGQDGADLELLGEADVARLASRYDRVVIGSGDHIFANRVRQLRDAGLVVMVVSRAGALSHELRRASSAVRLAQLALPASSASRAA